MAALFGKRTPPRAGPPPGEIEPIAASAARVTLDPVQNVITTAEWQSDAWKYYREIPEVFYGVAYDAGICSRARLYVGKVDPDSSSKPPPVPEERGDLIGPLDELTGGQAGQSRFLDRQVSQWAVAGESYWVGFDDPNPKEKTKARRWVVASSKELEQRGRDLIVTLPDSSTAQGEQIVLKDGKFASIRTWQPDPERGHLPISPMRALRGPCRMLLKLQAKTMAQCDSRIPAGLLKVPSELDFPDPDGKGMTRDPKRIMRQLMDTMVTPIKQPDSAAAVVPLMVQGPAEALAALELLRFGNDLDSRTQSMIDSAIRRIGTGLDAPLSATTGETGNHWSQWQISEDALRARFFPKLARICGIITEYFYWPALRALKVPDPEQYVIWFDPADMALRPNKGPEAIQAYELGLVAARVVRRELGFPEEDAPTQQEWTRWMAEQLLRQGRPLDPQLAPALGLGSGGTTLREGRTPPLKAPGQDAPRGEVPGTQPDNTTPNPGELDTRPPAPPPVTAAAVARAAEWEMTAAELAAVRALAWAGRWLINHNDRSQRGALQDVDRHAVHTHLTAAANDLDAMLAGAYSDWETVAPDQPCVRDVIDNYVRVLLLTRRPHQPRLLASMLADSACGGG
ncbi:hypothetical protein [Streptomyces alboflavus]|uniref:hypothetical protein n=1 Tax=Streptomyces alboflavus TaxID=67267 RepID=UPI0036C83788